MLIAWLWRGATAAGHLAVRATRLPTPGMPCGVARGLLADLARTKRQLLAENAFLRQQLLVAARGVKKPNFRPPERLLYTPRNFTTFLPTRATTSSSPPSPSTYLRSVESR